MGVNRPIRSGPVLARLLPEAPILRSDNQMDDSALSEALERSERALGRIERSLAARSHQVKGSEQELRSRVREAVAELDQLIRSAEETERVEETHG